MVARKVARWVVLWVHRSAVSSVDPMAALTAVQKAACSVE